MTATTPKPVQYHTFDHRGHFVDSFNTRAEAVAATPPGGTCGVIPKADPAGTVPQADHLPAHILRAYQLD